jgi:hypothetical protein
VIEVNMNKSLANTIGNRINEFDNLEVQTVGMFNELFPECPIRDVDLRLQVIILGPTNNNCRDIVVGDNVIKHKMYSDILYTLDKQDYFLDERDTELTEINGVPV